MGLEDSVRRRHTEQLIPRSNRRQSNVNVVLYLASWGIVLPVAGYIGCGIIKPRTNLPVGVLLEDDLSALVWSPTSEAGWQIKYAHEPDIETMLQRLVTSRQYLLRPGEDLSGLGGLVAGQFGVSLALQKGRLRLRIDRGSDPAVYRNLKGYQNTDPPTFKYLEVARLGPNGSLADNRLLSLDKYLASQLVITQHSNQTNPYQENLPGKIAPQSSPPPMVTVVNR